MQIPPLSQAEQMLREAEPRNPGPWVAHSLNVALAARLIAEHAPGLQPEAAYVVGLLHDIGRREGVTGMRHVLDGYRYLAGLGFVDAGRVCMTHSFAVKRIEAIFGEWDCTHDELIFLEDYLVRVEYDDYDRLIQLCDALAMADGFVLMEKRMMDVALRYGGVNEHTLAKWRETFRIKADFERVIGRSVYKLLPGVVENTFGGDNMRIFIGGVMQASNHGKQIVDQDYRRQIAAALQARWPEVEVIDPFSLHPNSVEYGDAAAKETLFAMVDLASHSDIAIAYVPTASMGTAMEMFAAYQNGVPVIAISPLATNWVVKALSRRVYGSMESFLAAIASAESPAGLF